MAKIEIVGVIGQDYFYSDFLTDYANAKQQGLIELHIDSLGGSVVEGFAIADFIKQHSADFLSVTNSGNIASIATTIFFALPFEKRTYDINKGFFVIHNPFVPNETIEDTTAQGLSDASEKLKEIEDKMVMDIVKATGADKEAVKALMLVDKPLTIEQIKAFNIANVEELRVVAFFNQDNNNNKMNKMNVLSLQMSLSDKQKQIYELIRPLENNLEGKWVYLEDVYDDHFIYSFGGEFFKQQYQLNEEAKISLIGTPIKVLPYWYTLEEKNKIEENVNSLLKNKKQMKNEEKTVLDKILAIFKKENAVALYVTDAEGNQINFPDVEEGTELKVGDKADGNVTGDVLLADGRTLVMADGVITEIKEKEEEEVEVEETPNVELEALRAENKELKKQLQSKVAALKNIESKVIALKADQVPYNGEVNKTRRLNEYLK